MSELTIPGVLGRAAKDFSDAEAVVDGDVRVTYAELCDRVRQATGAFIGAGIDPGDRIAIWAPNGLSWIVTVLGAMGATRRSSRSTPGTRATRPGGRSPRPR